jgi:hypothetical protein
MSGKGLLALGFLLKILRIYCMDLPRSLPSWAKDLGGLAGGSSRVGGPAPTNQLEKCQWEL